MFGAGSIDPKGRALYGSWVNNLSSLPHGVREKNEQVESARILMVLDEARDIAKQDGVKNKLKRVRQMEAEMDAPTLKH